MYKFPKKFNPGAFPDRPDARDFKYEDVVFGAPVVDWDKGYDIETELGITLKVESQNSSLSCVGQSFSKYAEVLNIVEEKKFIDLSAKSVYERIYLPSGGAYLRDGAAAVVKGINEEIDVPSYENGQPPSENYMRSQTLTPELSEKAKKYSAKEYRSLGGTVLDYFALAIKDNFGVVTGVNGDNKGWTDWIVNKPTSVDWGHAIFLKGFGKDSRGKYLNFINSWGVNWGQNGRGRIYAEEYDMANNSFGIWTLVDKPNTTEVVNNVRMVKTLTDPDIYMIRENKRILVIDMPTLDSFKLPFTIITDAEMATYQDGGTYFWVERTIN